MKNKKEQRFISISPVKSPYKRSDDDSIQDLYERYKADPVGSIEMNGQIYYRVIARYIVTTERGTTLLCYIDSRINTRIGHELVDEDGHRFLLAGSEHVCFRNPFPEWYFKAPGYILEGNEKELGEYLTAANGSQGKTEKRNE